MKHQRHEVFGWVIHKGTADAGEQFDIALRREAAHHRLSAQTLYTKGRITGHQEGDSNIPAATRVAGFGNDMLPNPVPSVTMKMTVQEDAEWWCVSVPSNKSLPAVEYIRLQPGESMPVVVGDLIFVCSGRASFSGSTVDGPIAVRVSSASDLLASDAPVYAMRFDREKIV